MVPVPEVAFGPGGFGPAGSGGYTIGTTPVPARSDVEEPPLAKEQEKRRPAYLVEGDDDEMFGNAEFTSPPVIGE
ncbi:hypothetical protein [Actinokineospora enzanensis]|uniref:hypothetical protein n=1 Tax=Actinokineospora enzanensis TaxID=155975 RepID=UPI000369E6ED|nr:hypothetical protein [Actinokineospora enzanensis]